MTATITREAAQAALLQHYDQARAELAAQGLFGKTLDRKARRHALKLAGVTLPAGVTVAWATPGDWARGALGYRGRCAADMRP